MATHAIAVIDESRCIGCAKCLAACPVDAIVGAERLMHTVIASECIGCELCLPPCPVDCIVMQPVAQKPFDDQVARARIKARKIRLNLKEDVSAQVRARLQSERGYDPVAAALARAQSKKH